MTTTVAAPARTAAPALVAWAGLVAVGTALVATVARNPHAHVNAPPFTGTWQALVTWRVTVPLVTGAAVVVAGPRLARRLAFPVLAVGAAAATLAWALALNWVDGPGALTSPLRSRYDYLHDLPRVGSLPGFLGSFVDQLPTYSTHVRGHPPGMLVLLWFLSKVGLAGGGWVAALVLTVGASTTAAVLLAARRVADEDTARRAAPFLVLLPAALWGATSADFFFAGVLAWGITLIVLGRSGWGGALLGAALFLTYAAAPAVLVTAVVLASRRQLAALRRSALGAGAVTIGFAAAGFWWPAGLLATGREYNGGISQLRPYSVFVVANLAVLAVAVGPAVAVGLSKLRPGHGLALLWGGALAAVLVADVSGMSRGEVERIWLPFVPWVALAAAEAPPGLLGVQAATGVVLQVMLRSPW